jgi:hypothetical protein
MKARRRRRTLAAAAGRCCPAHTVVSAHPRTRAELLSVEL